MLRLARGIIKAIIWIVAVFFFYVVASVLYYAIMPDVKYRPFCKIDGKIHYIEGPLRPEYKDWLKEGLTEFNFYYRKEGRDIYISRDSATGGTDLFPNQYEFFNNFEWRFIKSLSKGRGAGDTEVEPPKALLDLIAETEAGPHERDFGDDLSFRYFRSCAFKRAGAIWLEKLEDTHVRD